MIPCTKAQLILHYLPTEVLALFCVSVDDLLSLVRARISTVRVTFLAYLPL